MHHSKHMYFMVGLVAVGAVLFLSGFGGSAVFLLWPLACMGMMAAMMWGMSRSGSAPAPHTHADGLKHTHS